MKFVTIYNTNHSNEISIIRNLFEDNGIHYVMPDMTTDSALGMAGLGSAGMRVQVSEDQQEQAVGILKARGFS